MPAASCSPPATQSSSGVGSSASSGCSSSTGPASSSSAASSTGVSNTITSSSSAQFASSGTSGHSSGPSPPITTSGNGKPNNSDAAVCSSNNASNNENSNVSHSNSLRNYIPVFDSSRSNGSNVGNEQLSRTNLYIKGLAPETTDKILFELCSPYVFTLFQYENSLCLFISHSKCFYNYLNKQIWKYYVYQGNFGKGDQQLQRIWVRGF